MVDVSSCERILSRSLRFFKVCFPFAHFFRAGTLGEGTDDVEGRMWMKGWCSGKERRCRNGLTWIKRIKKKSCEGHFFLLPKSYLPAGIRLKERVIDHACHDMKRCVLTARKRSKPFRSLACRNQMDMNNIEGFKGDVILFFCVGNVKKIAIYSTSYMSF